MKKTNEKDTKLNYIWNHNNNKRRGQNMEKSKMKKILIVLDEKTIERLDKIIEQLNKYPEEGGGWNRSRAIRTMIYNEYKKFQHKKEKGL